MFKRYYVGRKLRAERGIHAAGVVSGHSGDGSPAAIVIQQFMIYRSRAIDTQMRSDLKSAAMAMESYFADFQSYPTSVVGIRTVGFRQSGGVTMTINVTSPSSFTLTGSNRAARKRATLLTAQRGLLNNLRRICSARSLLHA